MKNLILVFAIVASSCLQWHILQAQFFIDVNKILVKDEIPFPRSGEFLGGSGANFGFQKELVADNRFSNEFMLSYSQNRFYHNFYNSVASAQTIEIQRNLGLTGRLLFNHRMTKKSSVSQNICIGLIGGLMVQGVNYVNIGSEDNLRSNLRDEISAVLGALARLKVGNLYTQISYSNSSYLSSWFNSSESNLLSYDYSLSAGVGYQFGNRD